MESSTQTEETIQRAASAMDGVGKIAKPFWALIVALAAGGWWFGCYYSEYRFNTENGSPAVRMLLQGQQLQINKLTTLIEKQAQAFDIYQKDVARRLDRLEDRK